MLLPLLNALRYVIGPILVLCGFIGAGMGVMTIIDPAGAKAADDNDPFGTPPALWEGISLTLIFVALTFLGLWLLFSRRCKRSPQQAVAAEGRHQHHGGRR